jgi:hypothetical protein
MTIDTHTVRRLAALGTLATIPALALSGCGGEEDQAPPPQSEGATDRAPAATPQTAATNERPTPDQTLTAAGYEIRVWDGSDTGEGRLEMSRGGEVVYAVTGERFELGGPGPSAGRVGLGEDVTGDGVPNLVVELWTGGTVCCVDYLVYELDGPEPELLGRVSAQTGGRFEDYNGDGAMEIRIHDGAFLGWNASVEQSPMPPVILQWDGLWYAPAPELMQAPAPSHEQLAGWQRRVEAGEEWDRPGEFTPPAQLWGVALDLMYTGHPDLGRAFLHSAWNDTVPGREAFIDSLQQRLQRSEHWPVIARAQRASN